MKQGVKGLGTQRGHKEELSKAGIPDRSDSTKGGTEVSDDGTFMGTDTEA